MDSEVKVSIRCAVYNHEKYLRQCLDGFVMQKANFKFEAIVHDDASTDGSADIIREYAEKYPDIIKPIYQAKNLYSQGISRNSFVDPLCVGKYWAICEGDDYWTDENKLQKQADFLDNNKDYSFVAHSAYNIYEDGVVKPNLFKYADKDKTVPNSDIVSKGWLFPTAALFYRKEFGSNMPPQLKGEFQGDFSLTLWLSCRGKGYYFSKPMSIYRNNSVSSVSSMIKKDVTRRRESIIDLCRILTEYDELTNRKYHEGVRIGVLRFTRTILLMDKNFKECNKEEYVNLFGRIGLKYRIKQIIKKCLSEKIINKLRYYYIKSKKYRII